MINLRNCDCMPCIIYDEPNSVDFTLTDIPYGEVNRKDNGLRSLDRGIADVETFDLNIFLEGIYKITKNSICIFCGREQFS